MWAISSDRHPFLQKSHWGYYSGDMCECSWQSMYIGRKVKYFGVNIQRYAGLGFYQVLPEVGGSRSMENYG
jgi:hypothetical protein